MKVKSNGIGNDAGSTLLVALSAIVVLSLAGAAVLMNSTTRYNSTTSQVTGWKDALYAAEAGGDLAFAEIRKTISDSSNAFASANGWSSPAPSPMPGTNSWSRGVSTPLTFGAKGNLSAKVTVDKFAELPGSNPAISYYRIRSVGTAQLAGLKRVGMDNRMDVITTGDNLLRKIDFNFDHFISTYGHGDALASAPATAANGKVAVPVADPKKPQISRRIELIAIPIMPIEGAVKTAGRLRTTTFDSYNSANGPYPGTPNPPPPYDADAHDADAVCGNSEFAVTAGGYIWGDVTTNGGAATTNKVSGVVDNTVAVSLPKATPGVAPIPVMPGMTGGPTSVDLGNASGSIRPSPTPFPNSHDLKGQYPTEFWYTASAVNGLTVNPVTATVNGVANTPIETIVNIYVTGDVRGIVVNKGVTANLYFRGNVDGAARDFANHNIDGPDTGSNKVYVRNYKQTSGTYLLDPDTPYSVTPLVSRAGRLWFYGLSPSDGTSRSIDIGPPGSSDSVYAGFYAPSHDFTTRGNPDFYGVFLVKSFYTNGNNQFHFDKQLLNGTKPIDYRIASFIEDIR